MNKKVFNLLLSFCSLVLVSSTFPDIASAQLSGNPLNIPAFQVSGLSSYRGQYLTAYYTNSKANGISTDQDQIKMVRAYIVLKNIPIQQDALLFKSQSITWIDNKIPNYLIFVVHEKPDFLWVNTDVSIPDLPGGMSPIGQQDHSAISTLSIREMNSLPRLNNSSIASFDFGSSLPYGNIK